MKVGNLLTPQLNRQTCRKGEKMAKKQVKKSETFPAEKGKKKPGTPVKAGDKLEEYVIPKRKPSEGSEPSGLEVKPVDSKSKPKEVKDKGKGKSKPKVVDKLQSYLEPRGCWRYVEDSQGGSPQILERCFPRPEEPNASYMRMRIS